MYDKFQIIIIKSREALVYDVAVKVGEIGKT